MNLKNSTLLLSFILTFTFNSFSQEKTTTKPKKQIGITFSSFGDNDVIRFQQLAGAASYPGDNFYTIGLNYIFPINRTFDFETGIEYSKHNISVHPNLPPDMDNSPYPASLSLINIPVTARLNFLKYLFINGGFLFDIDISNSSPVDSQTGIGAIAGLGINYDFNFGVSLFANPYLKANALLPFSFENYPQRLMESGFRFGVMYKLQ
ncbi:MAG: hypothetical protein ABFS35_02580 [Bacteroidota bacterium]